MITCRSKSATEFFATSAAPSAKSINYRQATPSDAKNAVIPSPPERHIFEQADRIHVAYNFSLENYALRLLMNLLGQRGAARMPNPPSATAPR
jgi:hypothetical protein